MVLRIWSIFILCSAFAISYAYNQPRFNAIYTHDRIPLLSSLETKSISDISHVRRKIVQLKEFWQLQSRCTKSITAHSVADNVVNDFFQTCCSTCENETDGGEGIIDLKIEKSATSRWNINIDQIMTDSKNWVQSIIAECAVCPYTKNSDAAGIPRGNIRYTISNADNAEELMIDYWLECQILLQSSIEEASTVLLILQPNTLSLDVQDFEAFTTLLDEAFTVSNSSETRLEDELSNVYFHPQFQFQDGDNQNIVVFDDNGECLGLSNEIVQPISYARRSPYPIINILRSGMVKSAQKNVEPGKIFQSNKKRLEGIGSEALQRMLDERNWSAISPSKLPMKTSSVISIEKNLILEDEMLENQFIELAEDWLKLQS